MVELWIFELDKMRRRGSLCGVQFDTTLAWKWVKVQTVAMLLDWE